MESFALHATLVPGPFGPIKVARVERKHSEEKLETSDGAMAMLALRSETSICNNNNTVTGNNNNQQQ